MFQFSDSAGVRAPAPGGPSDQVTVQRLSMHLIRPGQRALPAPRLRPKALPGNGLPAKERQNLATGVLNSSYN